MSRVQARPFDPAKLRSALAPFPAPPPAVLADFLQHYQLKPIAMGVVSAPHHDLVSYRFEAATPKAELLFVIGYLDHVGLFSSLIDQCVAMGYNVTAFDLPGQGLSSGARMCVDDFARYREALQRMVQVLPDADLPRYAMGQSTGGGALLDLLKSQGRAPFQRVLLLNPLVRPYGWSYLRCVHWALKPWLAEIPRARSDGTHDPAFNEFLQHGDGLKSAVIPTAWLTAMVANMHAFLAMKPCDGEGVVVFQGTDERTVDAPWNLKQIVRKFPGVRVHWIDGARHHLANEAPQFRQPVLDELAKQLP
ncbi:alpha/beta fold hydrolase [Litorivicinus lipolyticus]|uniref:Alpha/beta fold hydrolase n=1 Tax=Litorivicinus lipolyticus TaxID=418701 RepID=A0A5Q2Q8B1_9GAMM|nr:alpha/beta hydrolase [Litorivicinus lipolyticus]QGG79293.1 alpha/beta fold hydrolase [Litorivicinus lipolyticus]